MLKIKHLDVPTDQFFEVEVVNVVVVSSLEYVAAVEVAVFLPYGQFEMIWERKTVLLFQWKKMKLRKYEHMIFALVVAATQM